MVCPQRVSVLCPQANAPDGHIVDEAKALARRAKGHSTHPRVVSRRAGGDKGVAARAAHHVVNRLTHSPRRMPRRRHRIGGKESIQIGLLARLARVGEELGGRLAPWDGAEARPRAHTQAAPLAVGAPHQA